MNKLDYRHHLRQHQRALIQGWLHFKSSPLTACVTVMTIGISLTLPLLLYLLLKNAAALGDIASQEAHMTVYFNPALSDTQTTAMYHELQTWDTLSSVTYTSKASALATFQSLTELDDALAALPTNPLPASVDLIPEADLARASLLGLEQKLTKLEGVDKVAFDWVWLERFQQILGFLRVFTILVATLLGVGVVFVVGNTIRLILDKHREEVDVHALIGATTSYVRRPFLYRGSLYGLLGATFALLVLIIAHGWLSGPAHTLAALYDTPLRLQFFSLSELMGVFSVSLVLGWVGAWIAVTQQWQIVNESLLP